DGQIAHVELRSQLDAWFTEWDLLQFGYLTAPEFAEGINGTMERLRAQAGGGAGPVGARRGGGNAGGFGGRRVGGGGPGGAPGGRPGGGGVDLDPLVLENDAARPLASRLLAVPELRARYLSYVRDIAENWLDWDKMGPRVLQYQALIEDDMKTDTRKLATTEAFFAGVDDGGGEASSSLRGFFERRRAFLLDHEEVKSAPPLDR
ncbi:CotH kinase family protein, partial [Opitutaceae bacterium]|nr:CotH kinase family protein [Opitutaceae bacterium]